MILIDHSAFDAKSGARVIFLKGRHKDIELPGGKRKLRTITKVSHSPEEWDECVQELVDLAQPGERIYASAAPRHMKKAIREFKERQLASEYDPDSELFYRSILDRWASCLMSTKAQEKKLWLIDIDTTDDAWAFEMSFDFLSPLIEHDYETKNGRHVLVLPFNKAKLPSQDLLTKIHDNPLILVGY